MGHYSKLEQAIKIYFKKKLVEIEIEPHGSRGPDIKGLNADGKLVIGEIKSRLEIQRDLSGYWGQWNSCRSFGGKSVDYKLKTNYRDKGMGLTSIRAKGWVAVIDGQLRGYCEKAGILQGILIIEKNVLFKNDINRAIEYLYSQGRISEKFATTNYLDIGYVTVNYTKTSRSR